MKKRDGEYYFQAVAALFKNHFTREHKAQFLALCPLCVAMYSEFVIWEGALVLNGLLSIIRLRNLATAEGDTPD